MASKNQSKPAVHIFTGPWHPELEEALLDDIRRLKASDPLQPVVVLCGSRLLCAHLQWLLAETLSGYIGIRFITFADLARDLSLPKRAPDSRPELPTRGTELIAALTASESPDSGYFSPLKDTTGFHRALARTFEDLDEAGFEDLHDHIAAFADPNGKLLSLAGLRKRYLERRRTFRTRTDDYPPLDDAGRVFREVYDCDRLHLFGIYDLTVLQARLVRSLTGEVELRVFFPYWSGDDEWGTAFSYAAPVLNLFRKLPDAEVTPLTPSRGCAGKGFSRRLFRYDPQEAHTFLPAGRSVRMFSARGTVAEIDALVGRINEEALENGIPFDRIGVLLWNPDGYHALLRQRLERAGIPYCDAIGTPLSDTPEGRATSALLKLSAPKLVRRELTDITAGHQLIFSDTDPDEVDTCAWEKISLDLGITEAGRERWSKALELAADRYERKSAQDRRAAKMHRQAELMRRFIDRLFEQLEALHTARNCAEFFTRAVRLIETFIPASAVRERIVETLEEFAAAGLPSEGIPVRRLVDFTTSVLRGVRIGRGKYRRDGVTVFDKMNGRGVACDVLFIPGLAQGAVPVRGAEDPILGDRERTLLASRTPFSETPLLPLHSRRIEEERMLFALSADSARRRLYLSYSHWDEAKGSPRLPSRFLLEICRILIGKSVPADGLPTHVPFFESDEKPAGSGIPPTESRLESRVVAPEQYPRIWIERHIPAESRHTAMREVFAGRSPAFDRAFEALRARRRAPEITGWDGLVGGSRISNLLPDFVPVTDLEEYAKCPFNYLLHRLLKTEPWEEPEAVIEPPPQLIGTLIHRVLKKFYEQAKNEHRIPLTGEHLDWAKAVLAQTLRGELRRSAALQPAPGAVWSVTANALETRLTTLAHRLCADDTRFQVIELEKEFAKRIAFEMDDGRFVLPLRGRIDRLDKPASEDAVRIVDYKTGTHVQTPGKFNGGTNLQLPIYLQASLDDPAITDPEACSALYLQIDPYGAVKKFELTGGQLNARCLELGALVKALAEGINRGLFPPLPYSVNLCSTCSSHQACDLFSRAKCSGRLGDDPLLEPIRSAREIE